VSASVEGRYKLRPDLYVAARYDHLGFSDETSANETLPWDAPVTRIEVGAGYSIQRNLLLKGSYQHDDRDGGFLLKVAHMLAAQLVFWF
jgi:predicted porin